MSFQPTPSRLPPYAGSENMPSSVSSRVVSKNGVRSTVFRYSTCCVGRERRERCGAWMLLAKRRLKLGELRAIVAGELREKCRQRPIDEVHDAGLARTGRVVGRNDLRGDGFDVRRFGRAEK